VLFKIIKLNYKRISGMYFIRGGFYKLCSLYDVVIFMPDLHYISYCLLPFISRQYKVIPWGIGIRASYTRRYDVNRKKDFIDRIYQRVLSKSDAIIFYMKAPIRFWGDGIDKNKIFIAHNTVGVLTNESGKNETKNRILFIGKLYKEKKIYELLDAYIEARSRVNRDDFLLLDIIGEGEEKDNLEKIIEEQGLSDSVSLHGPVYDEKELAKYFSISLICISPDQAGLSVLKSMGYGVPFVSRVDSITGGERLNIINKENGLLYNTKEELVSIIVDAYKEPEIFATMGINARKYYMSNATPEHMARGVLDAIDFVIKSDEDFFKIKH
jgi:glycosyltransferase involved in cell wall biosynthesis